VSVEPILDRRAAIVHTASALFAEQGYGSVGMRAIADAVGIRASSLYHHFPSKLDLLYAVAVVATEAFIAEQLPELEDGPGTNAERLARVLRRHVVYFHEHRHEEAAGLRELAQLRLAAPEKYEHVQRQRRAYQDAIERAIARGVAAGELDAPDTGLAALAVLGLVNSIRQWFDPEGPRSIDEVADAYAAFAVDRLLGARL
jgi:AcrR family transcriptional regulator